MSSRTEAAEAICIDGGIARQRQRRAASTYLLSCRTIDETSDVLNVSPRTVRRLIDSGALPVHRFGRLVRIADADIAVLLAENRIV